MKLTGEMLIGSRRVMGAGDPFQAVNPSTGQKIGPPFGSATAENVDRSAELAWKAFSDFRATDPESRACFLEACAEEIFALGDVLIERAMAETGLPRARLEGERGRTVMQLRLFASVVRQGRYLDVRIDPAQPERQPLPRPDLRMRRVPLGPVAVFGASNFPLAFSVAGGDTASALAAGCPVVVKAHPAHPGTSELVGRALQKAVSRCQLHEGVFSLLFDCGHEVGQALVSHSRIKAAGFTGSRAGGLALMKAAASRAEPIPFYAEMSSINPVFLMPAALKARGDDIASGFVNSLQMGAGQFCTNPGLVIASEGGALDAFVDRVSSLLSQAGSQTMLTPAIHSGYRDGVSRLAANSQVKLEASGQLGEGPGQCQAHFFSTSVDAFIADPGLSEEIFGATALLVRSGGPEDFIRVARQLEGQLTATLHVDEDDHDRVRQLLPVLEDRVGRILCNGFPTGVEVCHAMVHGGPFPATSDSRTTSVGSAAIERFVRPVCYQDLPQSTLPDAVQDTNPWQLPRLIDGDREP